MRQLPSGTVTFVFTDIEGSTRLLRELGDRYAAVLDVHRRVLRTAFAENGGVEVDTQGDAFFYVFPSAEEAVAAARSAQAALEGGPVRVRMGLHTGTPIRTEEGYIGLEVHRAARIAAAGHGGQIVISRATYELAPNLDVRDLGQHRIKDFDEAVWLFQVGERNFPPLKTIANSNLPRPTSTFVGREREIPDLVGLLETNRLVSLIGPGGSGKTRLAIEAGAELVGSFIHGVYWVDLAAIRDPRLVLPSVAQTMGAHGELARDIGDKHLLVLLDNLEQVIDAAPDVAALVEACANMTVLVTSRERLRVRGEVAYEVEPLADADAIELFCARAQVAPSDSVAELCRRLDSMPLAVELAAARGTVLSAEQILDRLASRLDLFKGGRDADPRQASLRATLAWSHALLPSAEQELLGRLAVFVGGWDVLAAEEVCGADIDALQALVDKSLVRHTGDRFWMLETVREFAGEQLAMDAGEPDVRLRHAKWAVTLAGRLNARGPDQDEAHRTLRLELPNIRAAIDEMTTMGLFEDRLRVVTALAQPMFQLGAAPESRDWLEGALDACAVCAPHVVARAHVAASLQSTITGDRDAGMRHGSMAAELAVRMEDDLELASDVALAMGVAEQAGGNLEAAERFTRQGLELAGRLGDGWRMGELRNNLSYIALSAGDLEVAREAAQAALVDAEVRQDHHIAAILLHNLSMIGIKSGAIGEAVANLERALEVCSAYGLESILANAIETIAAIAEMKGAHTMAATLLGASAVASRNAGGVEDDLRLVAAAGASAALGDEQYAEEVALGSALGLEDAATRARQWLDSIRGAS